MLQHFTLAYCPWSNDAVELLDRKLLQAARAVMSELQIPFENWPNIHSLIQSAINNAASPHRSNFAPVTAFQGIEPTPPITFSFGPLRASNSRSAFATRTYAELQDTSAEDVISGPCTSPKAYAPGKTLSQLSFAWKDAQLWRRRQRAGLTHILLSRRSVCSTLVWSTASGESC